MQKQALSQPDIPPDFRSDTLLQLMALAVHLLEDDEEKVEDWKIETCSLQLFRDIWC